MKKITIELTDYEWKELSETIRHELGELLSDGKVEKIVKKDVLRFVRDSYKRALQ